MKFAPTTMPEYSVRRLLSVCGAALILFNAVGTAQVKPVSGTREALVIALNSFLAGYIGQSTAGPDPFPFDEIMFAGDENDDLFLLDPIASADGCGVWPLDVTFEFFPDFFVMRRTMPAALQGQDDGLDHELAADLNAWLNAVWAMELKGIPEFDALDEGEFRCGTSDNRFYTKETEDAAAIDVIRELTGENEMLEKWYVINGAPVQGSSLFNFEKTSPRVVRYMTDRGDPALDEDLRDTIRYLGNAYLQLSLPGQGVVFEFELLLQTSPYQTGNCGESVTFPHPDEQELFYNRVNVDAQIRTVPNGGSNTDCLFGWMRLFEDQDLIDYGFTNDPDVSSNNLFNYLRDHRGEWRFNPTGEDNPGNSADKRILQMGSFRVDENGNLLFVRYYTDCCKFLPVEIGSIMNAGTPPAEVCETAFCRGGEFVLDQEYQMLYYQPSATTCPDCPDVPVLCLPFCDSAAVPAIALTHGLRADARRYTDRTALVDETEFWRLSPKLAPVPWFRRNEYERGIRGKWRPFEEFVYRTGIKAGTALFDDSDPDERNYNDAGTFAILEDQGTQELYDFEPFNWLFPQVNNPETWLNPTRVTRYSQNGEPVEERDIFDIPSAAHFGYREQVPILVAKNATYNSARFEAFEEGTGNEIGKAHSGAMSLRVDYDEWMAGQDWLAPVVATFTVDEYCTYDATAALSEKDRSGLLLRFWATPFWDPATDEIESPVDFKLESEGTEEDHIVQGSIRFVAKTGEWGLFEAELKGLTDADLGKTVNLRVQTLQPIIENSEYTKVWIDDLRLQPMKSEMACYVYNADNLRQAAQFDDQHFGVFFQYNDEGKLIRKLRETERGIRTVQETQYNTPLAKRDKASPTASMGTVVSSGGMSGYAGAGTDGSGGSAFDLLSIDLGLNRRDVSVFGVEAARLGERVSEMKRLLEIPSLKGLDLPEIEKLRLVEELDDLSRRLDSLEQVDRETLAEEERSALDTAREESIRTRSELMERFGLTESDLTEILPAAREVRARLKDDNTEPNGEPK